MRIVWNIIIGAAAGFLLFAVLIVIGCAKVNGRVSRFEESDEYQKMMEDVRRKSEAERKSRREAMSPEELEMKVKGFSHGIDSAYTGKTAAKPATQYNNEYFEKCLKKGVYTDAHGLNHPMNCIVLYRSENGEIMQRAGNISDDIVLGSTHAFDEIGGLQVNYPRLKSQA